MSVSATPTPSGVVTFLFTDVEGSTRRWEADAEGMRVALAAHDEVLCKAIEAHGGRLFKHTGDGVCAAFSSPRSAVDAAVAAQRELELPVRMGIATGEAELRDGDYFGAVLNRAARVMAAGHGGQILLAESTAGLLTGVDLVDLGPRRLRDLPTPIGMFQIRAAGLRTDFPPLRALDVTPGNLRAATTSFIGRESEVGEVQAAVKAHRLVTLTGVGGVGKTRLALEVAARLADEFPDGVWFFELAAVTDPAAVPDAVAAVLGITQQPGKSVANSVAAALEGRVRLLVFDNCEHVLDAAADLIEAILAASATTKIVATSREGLGIADERLWPVPSLDVGAGIDSAAVALFVERAQHVSPRFTARDAGEAAAVVEICRRLDGIPLAIELAASRMAAMTAGEVRDRLDQRFRLLVGSRRGLERHHTLRHGRRVVLRPPRRRGKGAAGSMFGLRRGPVAASGWPGGASTRTNSSTPNSASAPTSPTLGLRSATDSRNSARSRPEAAHSCSSLSIRSRTAATPSRLNPYQPSPHAATRSSAGSLLPPTTTGIRRSRTGLGLTLIESNPTNFPSNEATSSRHNVRIAATYSAVRAARCSNGTPSAANSSLDHPTPTPRVSRPPLNRSRLAACLATTTGLCSGSSSTPVATPIRDEAAAAKLSAIIGSSQSACAGTAMTPSSE